MRIFRNALTGVLVVSATLAAAALAVPAQAAAPEFRYQATFNADPHRDIPGTAITFAASAAGETSYLWSRNLRAENVTALRSGENVGNTFAIRCRDAAGAQLPGEAGAYWAANLVPTGETSVTPTLRWLFVAPAAGTYTCLLSVTSYSSVVSGSRSITMRIPAGASLARASYPRASRWTLQAAGSARVVAGSTLSTLGVNVRAGVPDADRITVTQDAAISTCKAGSNIDGCSGGSSSNPGSTVETWIEAQPQAEDGDACGTILRSPAVRRGISTLKHHLTMTNTLYLTESQFAGCAKLRVTLKVRNAGGNPVLVHGGLVTGVAATHGIVFEYA